jgi:hypothetical protein
MRDHQEDDAKERSMSMFDLETGQQPQNGSAPLTGQSLAQPASRHRGWIWGVVAILLVSVLLSMIQLAIGLGQAVKPFARPVIAADQYYTALKNHDYAQAYTFLAPNLTTSLSQEEFTSMARQRDAMHGVVSSYSFVPDFANHPTENVTVTVTRIGGSTYTAHLHLQQVGQAWEITAFDRI